MSEEGVLGVVKVAAMRAEESMDVAATVAAKGEAARGGGDGGGGEGARRWWRGRR